MRGYRKPTARQALKRAARVAAAMGNVEAKRVAEALHGGAMAQARGAGRWNLRSMLTRVFFTMGRR